jgi:hypothetical protein
MNQIRTDEGTVENRILQIIYLDQQIAELNSEAQTLTGNREQRRATGLRINREIRRINVERRRIVQEIRRHEPARHVLSEFPIYEQGSPISTSPNSPTGSQRSLRLSEIIDVDDSLPGSPIYAPGSPIYEPGSPIYEPGSPIYEPGSPIYEPGSPGSVISTVPNSPSGSVRSLDLSDLDTSQYERIGVDNYPPGTQVLRIRPTPSQEPTRGAARRGSGGTKKRKGKKRKSAKKKKTAKKGKKTKKR